MLGEGGCAPSPGLARLFGALADFEPSPDLRQDLKQLALVRSRLDLLMSELAVSLCDSRIWEEDAYCSPIQWLREEARLATGVAIQQLGVGLSRARLAESAAAMERGEIAFGHLALIAETAACYRAGGFEEGLFLEKAREQNLTQFRRTCEHARHAQDPGGFAESEREEHEHRCLKLSPQEGGALRIQGWLDPEGGSRLRSALEPLARKSGVGDQRSREQRLADALVEATAGEQQTELVVTCTLETLEGRAGSAAETEWGGLLSGETVERLVCGGASMRRLVLDSAGVVIDFGRKQRLLSAPARRALEARDRHCVWPGCDRPPRWCESHHRREWRLGGVTAVAESALLCRRHHQLRHRGGWQLFKNPAGHWRVVPPLPPRWPTTPDPPGPIPEITDG